MTTGGFYCELCGEPILVEPYEDDGVYKCRKCFMTKQRLDDPVEDGRD